MSPNISWNTRIPLSALRLRAAYDTLLMAAMAVAGIVS